MSKSPLTLVVNNTTSSDNARSELFDLKNNYLTELELLNKNLRSEVLALMNERGYHLNYVRISHPEFNALAGNSVDGTPFDTDKLTAVRQAPLTTATLIEHFSEYYYADFLSSLADKTVIKAVDSCLETAFEPQQYYFLEFFNPQTKNFFAVTLEALEEVEFPSESEVELIHETLADVDTETLDKANAIVERFLKRYNTVVNIIDTLTESLEN